MNILTIDTALDRTYVAVSIEGEKNFRTIENTGQNYHSLYLPKILKELNMLDKIEYLGVNTGVGSFTGIRTGLSIAKVITGRLKIKACAFTTFEALSKAYNNKNIVLDAKRGSAFYTIDGKNIEMISYETALTRIKAGDTYICDSSIYSKFNLSNLIPFENKIDLCKFELEIVENKIKNNEIINSIDLKPTYIQTPPIFLKN
ncbi:MAG: tRNA (adenosine(37)-N6)-threonylcarbamoyltransferase complex dimerization subunit type 1 TsaB [Candidatus Gastranaerophilales bacterium]|nr:tRNA (adenosine(37)-N6)-threonylcarbamoyltransferase complex dimerization subunit type 1 TsaB [Candidatus Gastranaerophilales bacterium]